VDSDACCRRLNEPLYYALEKGRPSKQNVPCISLEQSSGRYLMMTLRRLYLRNPYNGDFSSYWAMLLRISTMPPLPRPSSSTSSREAYLSRNLVAIQGQHRYAAEQSVGPEGPEIPCPEHSSCTVVSKATTTTGRDIPSSRFRDGRLVCLLDSCLVQPIQRHLGRAVLGASSVSLSIRDRRVKWLCLGKCPDHEAGDVRWSSNEDSGAVGKAGLLLSRADMERLARRKVLKLRG
jgi:hypothetical protein